MGAVASCGRRSELAQTGPKQKPSPRLWSRSLEPGQACSPGAREASSPGPAVAAPALPACGSLTPGSASAFTGLPRVCLRSPPHARTPAVGFRSTPNPGPPQMSRFLTELCLLRPCSQRGRVRRSWSVVLGRVFPGRKVVTAES